MLCYVLDRRCTAVDTCLCVFLYVVPSQLGDRNTGSFKKKLGDRSIPCAEWWGTVFLSLPSTTANFPASHYYYEASHFAASFAVCCSTILYYMPVFGTLCLPHVLNDKGCKCKCKVGSYPKLSCCFPCFLERGREERHCIGVLEVVAMIFGNFLLHLPSSSNEYLSQLKVLLNVFN